MAEEIQVLRPETITDQPLPTASEMTTGNSSGSASSGQVTKEVYTPQTTLEKRFPIQLVVYELMSVNLDTQTKKIKGEFTFTSLGAITIGKYVNGVSGEVTISPNGIVALNLSGDTTFALDGTNGNATFKGTIQAGSVVAGDNNVQIGGSASGGYIVIYVSALPSIVLGVI